MHVDVEAQFAPRKWGLAIATPHNVPTQQQAGEAASHVTIRVRWTVGLVELLEPGMKCGCIRQAAGPLQTVASVKAPV